MILGGNYIFDHVEQSFSSCLTMTHLDGTVSYFTGSYSLFSIGNYGRTSATTPETTIEKIIDYGASISNISRYAFASITYMTEISLPALVSAGMGTFQNCYSLVTASLPACTYIEYQAFVNCSQLTTASFPLCRYIGNQAFNKCLKLTTAYFPACSQVGNYTFGACTMLSNISFPTCRLLGANAFANALIPSAYFPSCASMAAQAFQACQKMSTASFPMCSYIGSSAFQRCYSLVSLYLTGSSVCALQSSNAFDQSPIGGYSAMAKRYGSIYVPASILTEYQNNGVWSYFSSRFVGV